MRTAMWCLWRKRTKPTEHIRQDAARDCCQKRQSFLFGSGRNLFPGRAGDGFLCFSGGRAAQLKACRAFEFHRSSILSRRALCAILNLYFHAEEEKKWGYLAANGCFCWTWTALFIWMTGSSTAPWIFCRQCGGGADAISFSPTTPPAARTPMWKSWGGWASPPRPGIFSPLWTR